MGKYIQSLPPLTLLRMILILMTIIVIMNSDRSNDNDKDDGQTKVLEHCFAHLADCIM